MEAGGRRNWFSVPCLESVTKAGDIGHVQTGPDAYIHDEMLKKQETAHSKA
jgi:hypothetical protein